MLIPFAVCRDKEWWNRSKVWLERIHRTDPRNHPIRDGCASISREEARTEWRQQGLLIRPVGKWSERNRSRVVRAMHFYCIIGVDIRWNALVSVVASSVHGILKHCKLHLLAIVVGYALPRDRKEFFSLPPPSLSNLAPWFRECNRSSYLRSLGIISNFVSKTSILLNERFTKRFLIKIFYQISNIIRTGIFVGVKELFEFIGKL